MIRDFEREILPMARQFGLALVPWDTLGGGRLQTAKQVRPFSAGLARSSPLRAALTPRTSHSAPRQIEAKKKNGEGLRTVLGGPEQTDEEKRFSSALEQVA